ncbi:protein of unknown function [Rhodovastum atsumiense]|nr:protein of unknown function [Rhodovastum atsumiense]
MQVHPRVSGGAIVALLVAGVMLGPSPRGRGSLVDLEGTASMTGSIPAWAGEPTGPETDCTPDKVHPRVGGGADRPQVHPQSS